VLIPATLDRYFPQIADDVTLQQPAVYVGIHAALFTGSLQVGLVETRYQYQTWGGTRPPERRITGNLGPIHGAAARDDILLIERSLADPQFYRVTLHRAGTAGFNSLLPLVGTRRWGPLYPDDIPVPETEIIESIEEQEEREVQPFELFDNEVALRESRVRRIARSRAFSQRILPLYDYRCAVCGNAHAAPDNLWEAEAAHIVPRGLKGADDARNGLALCKSHHWAFDRGLFGIWPNRRIAVRPAAAAEPRNHHLGQFDGELMRPPTNLALQPDLDALAWHLANVAQM
jgi:putative restriction endonuclease